MTGCLEDGEPFLNLAAGAHEWGLYCGMVCMGVL